MLRYAEFHAINLRLTDKAFKFVLKLPNESYNQTYLYTATLMVIIITLSTFFPALSQAKESDENWYQIEYIIFEHINADPYDLRYEDTPTSLPKRSHYLHLLKQGEALSPFHVIELDENNTVLNDALNKLKNSPDIKVHDHGAWQQALQRGQYIPPLKIEQDTDILNAQKLLGELQIKRERYLHVAANLYLENTITLPYADLKTWLFEEDTQRWPLDWLLQPLAYQHPSLEAIGESEISQNRIHLEQTRRIKNGEIHYIDHPVIGLIVTIKKVDSPYNFENENSAE